MISKEVLRKLYRDQKFSMAEIAGKVGVTPNKVGYWLKKYNIPRRSWSESSYVKQNPEGDPLKIKLNLIQRDKELLVAGLMLFLGEGGRKNKHSIQLGNLNPAVLQIFTKFLRKICQIKEGKLKLLIRLHPRFNKKKVQIYWSKILKIPKKQILVYTHNDSRNKEEKQKSPYGIGTLMFCNTKLKKWLSDYINKYIKKLLEQ